MGLARGIVQTYNGLGPFWRWRAACVGRRPVVSLRRFPLHSLLHLDKDNENAFLFLHDSSGVLNVGLLFRTSLLAVR